MGKHSTDYARVERHLAALAASADLVRPANAAAELPYNAADDFSRSIDACYRAVRQRVAAGGKVWPR